MLVALDGHAAHGGNGFGKALGNTTKAAILLEGDLYIDVVGDETILLLHVGIVPGGAVNKILVEGLEEGRKTWSLEVGADTWLAEMNEAAVGLAVEGQRKEETFQVGWRMLSQLSDGHSMTRLGRVTHHDLVREDFWRLPEKRAVPSERIMMKPLWNSPSWS